VRDASVDSAPVAGAFRPGGLLVPLITPFDGDGALDRAALEAHANAVLGTGAAGVVALATTGEPTSLDERERAAVVSICADYFMDKPLLRCSAAESRQLLQRLEWLIGICPAMGIGRIVLPFVDDSAIRDDAERNQVVANLSSVLPVCERQGVELHLETDLGPAVFRALLAELENPLIKVNYDAGNSASLGYQPAEEFAAYGHRIGSFHIKDRRERGGTVPLGQGAADFPSLREQLVRYRYRGDFVMQVARGEAGDELRWLAGMAKLSADWLRGLALNDKKRQR